MDSQRQAILQPAINNNSMRQTTQTPYQMAVNKYHTMMQPKTFVGDKTANAAEQTKRVIPGMAQGVLKRFATPGVAMESLPQNIKETLHIGGAQRPMTLPDGNRLHGSPASTGKPITEAAQHLNQGIQNRTDAWVPPAQTAAAAFVAKASDVLGEAVPSAALAVVTSPLGAAAALTGTAASYTAGAANAFSTEMLEGTGDVGRAALSAATEWGVEAAGGKIFGALSGNVGNPIARFGMDSFSEGAEEVMSGVTQAVLTGEAYTLAQAKDDFAVGLVVGAGIGTGVSGVNVIKNEIGTAKTVHDIRSGRGGGALEGLSKSIEIAQANPEQYGDIARALAIPAQESSFDTTRFKSYVENAVKNAGNSSLRIPANVAQIDARNVGGFETLTADGMKRAASVLEAAQVGKGLNPRQSGEILRAVLETNSNYYAKLGQISAQGTPVTEAVQIDLGKDYHDSLPVTGAENNYSVVNTIGRAAETSEADRPVNVFRGMSSEWVIPTIEAGEFVVPNPSQSIESGSPALFGSGPGQMLGAGLYLTSIPSKADQYTSGVSNEISLQGRDSSGIMENSILIGGTTYVNDAALAAAEQGIVNDTVRIGRSGDENALKDFINASTENSEAAVIYSKMGNDYTEIVRPDANKTQINRLYMPLNGTAQTAIDKGEASASELGRQRAESAATEAITTLGNAEVNTLLEQNISARIKADAVAVEGSKQDEIVESLTRSASGTAENHPFVPTQVKSEAVPLSVKEDTANEMNAMNSATSVLAGTSMSEANAETPVPRSKETPMQTSESQTRQNIETTTEELSAEERASQIWTPAASMANQASKEQGNQRRQEDKHPGYDFSTVRGSGSRGQIFETTGYGRTFGGLSSF